MTKINITSISSDTQKFSRYFFILFNFILLIYRSIIKIIFKLISITRKIINIIFKLISITRKIINIIFKLILIIRKIIKKLFFYNNILNVFLNQTRSSIINSVEKIDFIADVKLIGGSSIYIKNNKVFHPESIDVNLDKFAEEYRGYFTYDSTENKIQISSHYTYPEILSGFTLNLMGGVSNNYAHWLSEILPRLFYVLQNNQFKKITILVNFNIHKNLISTILKLTSHLDEVDIKMVDNGIILQVQNLCSASNIGYCQFEPRILGFTPYLNLNSNLIRRMALRLGEGIEPKNYKKIYLERGSNSRSIINNVEVKLLLEKYGYTTVNTENLSFDDQVSIFKGAEFIIGPTGGAFSNCIFCNDGANLNILTTTNKNHLLSYWPSFLGEDRLNIKYLKQSVYDESEGTSASFIVNLDSLLTVLR